VRKNVTLLKGVNVIKLFFVFIATVKLISVFFQGKLFSGNAVFEGKDKTPLGYTVKTCKGQTLICASVSDEENKCFMPFK
jgi:hypothetical protein